MAKDEGDWLYDCSIAFPDAWPGEFAPGNEVGLCSAQLLEFSSVHRFMALKNKSGGLEQTGVFPGWDSQGYRGLPKSRWHIGLALTQNNTKRKGCSFEAGRE